MVRILLNSAAELESRSGHVIFISVAGTARDDECLNAFWSGVLYFKNMVDMKMSM